MHFHPAHTNGQARGGGSRKELADVGRGKLLLPFSCSAAPDGWAPPLAVFWFITAGTAWPCWREGGRSTTVSGLLLVQSASSPAGRLNLNIWDLSCPRMSSASGWRSMKEETHQANKPLAPKLILLGKIPWANCLHSHT